MTHPDEHPSTQRKTISEVLHDIYDRNNELWKVWIDNHQFRTQAFPGARLVDFGHLGDGNLHYNVQAPEGVPAADFLREHEPEVNRIVYAAVAAHEGSFSAEHGIGRLKREELAHSKSPVALSLMRAIKQALDPAGIMNPGRVL